MPDTQLNWEQVRDVLVKRRKAGQAPHWCMGWVAARVARNENAVVNEAYKHTVLDYYSQHAHENEDAVKTRVWHRMIGFVDGLHNAGLPDAHSAPDTSDTTTAEVPLVDDDKTLVMDP